MITLQNYKSKFPYENEDTQSHFWHNLRLQNGWYTVKNAWQQIKYTTEANIRIKSITYVCYTSKHFKGPLKIQVSPFSNGGIKSKSRFCRDGALIN